MFKRQADDDLVGLERHHQQRKDVGEDHCRQHAAQHAEPGGAGQIEPMHGEERADQHLPFQADVEDAGLGGERAAKRDQKDRRRGAKRRDDQRDVEQAL